LIRISSNTPLVFDACALTAYLKGERGASFVESMLRGQGNRCVAHGVNVCEVFYLAIAAAGEKAARKAIDDLLADGLKIDNTFDDALWHQVARLKTEAVLLDADGYGPPLADCFCIAFAQRIGGEIVTSDHDDFDAVHQNGVCSVTFIR